MARRRGAQGTWQTIRKVNSQGQFVSGNREALTKSLPNRA
jgi:hypothetical protein